MGAPQTYRQRYIAVQADEALSKKDLEKTISQLNQKFSFSPSPKLIIYEEDLGEGLIKCGHLQIDRLKKGIKNQEKVEIEILGVSGTIKKTRKKFLSL